MEKQKIETLEFLKMCERMIKAAARRCGSADEHELSAMYDLKRSMDVALDHAIQSQLADGKSWANIGAALGMTRQGAQRRFGK